MRTEQGFKEGKRTGQIRRRKDGGVFATGPGSTYPLLPPPVWLLSHLEPSGRRLVSETLPVRISMILQRLFRFSSVIQSAVSVHLRRNIGVTAVAFKELDPIQKLFVDKIREYKSKRQTAGGPVDTGPEYQQDLERELFKLKQMFGKGDMNTFPTFTFEDPKFEVFDKPPA
nr:ATP synthase-coupling factor 6, mitochondrial isoform X1 [Callithrix jacchus]